MSVAVPLAELLGKSPAEQAGPAGKRAKCSVEAVSLPLLGKFVDVFLAFGSEVIARLDSEPTLKSKYLDRLDPTFTKLYNENVANTPLKPIDLGILRTKYSVLYSYGTGPAPEPAKVYDSKIEIGDGVSLDVRRRPERLDQLEVLLQ